MLQRTEYLNIIEEIRNTEKKSLDEYIISVLEPLRNENPNFIEILYKDINYLINDIDKPHENDLKIIGGDFSIENGDLALTGYQSRLHNLAFWLHTEIIKGFIESNPSNVTLKIEDFEVNFLNKPNYTPEYKSKLDKIKQSLKRERKQNLNERENLWEKLWDLDNLELKPNIAGIGFNFNNFLNKFNKNK